MSYLPLIDLKNGFWPVVHLLYRISEWNFTDMLNIKGYIFLVRTVTLTFPVHELSALDWSEKWFLTCSSFTIWSIWMKLHRYVDHQRLHIVTKDVISLSISVLLLFRHYISHKITFGAPSSGGVLRSACGAFIDAVVIVRLCHFNSWMEAWRCGFKFLKSKPLARIGQQNRPLIMVLKALLRTCVWIPSSVSEWQS